MKGTLYTAGPFGNDDITNIERKFSNMLGQRVELFHIEDDSLIGGFLAEIDGVAYDASVRTAMHGMKVHMEQTEER